MAEDCGWKAERRRERNGEGRMAAHFHLWDLDGWGVIISWPSGVMMGNQTGGYSCLQPEMEGVFYPLSNGYTTPGQAVPPVDVLMKYFVGPRWGGEGATRGLEEEDADFIDRLLKRQGFFPGIQVDRSRLRESHESWVHMVLTGDGPESAPVLRGFGPYPRAGVLTWPNSD
jgi:hypothetical protein